MKKSLTDIIIKKWKLGLLLLAIVFAMNCVVPGTWIFQKPEILHVRIAKETFTRTKSGEPILRNEEVITLSDKSSIEQFASIWSNQLFVLPPSLSGVSGFSVDENTENYWIIVSYMNTMDSIYLFDNYGKPIRINERHLWFSLFRSREHIYREIKELFDRYQQ